MFIFDGVPLDGKIEENGEGEKKVEKINSALVKSLTSRDLFLRGSIRTPSFFMLCSQRLSSALG